MVLVSVDEDAVAGDVPADEPRDPYVTGGIELEQAGPGVRESVSFDDRGSWCFRLDGDPSSWCTVFVLDVDFFMISPGEYHERVPGVEGVDSFLYGSPRVRWAAVPRGVVSCGRDIPGGRKSPCRWDKGRDHA